MTTKKAEGLNYCQRHGQRLITLVGVIEFENYAGANFSERWPFCDSCAWEHIQQMQNPQLYGIGPNWARITLESMPRCETCGQALHTVAGEPVKAGRPKRWCSESCRYHGKKAQAKLAGPDAHS